MNKEAITPIIKELVALSIGGFEKDGSRYVKLLFDNQADAQVTRLINEIRTHDLEGSLHLEYNFLRKAQLHKLSMPSTVDLPIYGTFQELFNRLFPMCINGSFDEDHRDFFILDGSGFECDVAYQQFIRLQSWVAVCKQTIENHHIAENNKTLNLYIVEELESEKQVKTRCLKISNPMIYNVFGSISEVPHDFDIADDHHFAIEKKAVLKSTFLKFFKKYNNESVITDHVIQDPLDFRKQFFNDYEFYTRKYSIDKVTREVESAKMEYLDKMNTIIHDNQAKALVIPAVLLGTALVRAWSLPAGVLLLTSMVLALFLVRLNLVHKRQSIEDCRDSAINVLGRLEYEQAGDSAPGSQSSLFLDAKTKINDNAKRANKLFNNIDFGLFMGLLTWLVYIFYLFKSS
ncbi:hypothetical protein AB6C57_05085 [Vibrio splendidus]